jgi:ABC-type transport system involved in multi-copper enzyme maturation permease subunit
MLQRELRAAARKKRTFILRTVYLGIMTLVLAMYWVGQRDRSSSRYYGGQSSADEIIRQHYESASVGREFATAAMMTQIVMLAFLAPVLTSATISSERSSKTLGVLLTTDLSVREIVVGKLLSRTWIVFLLIGLSLPVLLIARLLGGISTIEIVECLSIAALLALFAGSLGLLFSIFTTKAMAAAMISYLIMAALYVAAPVAIEMGRYTSFPAWGMWLHPFIVITLLMEGPSRGFVDGSATPWMICGGAHLAAALIVSLVAMLALRRVARRDIAGRVQPELPTSDPSPGGSVRRASFLTRFRRRLRPRVFGNPVMWMELVIGRRRRPIVTAIVIVLAAAIAIAFGNAIFELKEAKRGELESLVYASGFGGYALFFLATAMASAQSVAGEKDRNSWLLLLSTAMRPRDILLGKFAGIWRRLLPALLILFGVHAAFVAVDVIDPRVFCHLALIVAGPVLFYVVVGMRWSMYCRNATVAGVAQLATVVGSHLGPLFVLMLLAISGIGNREEEIAFAFLILLPMTWGILALEGAWEAKSMDATPYTWAFDTREIGFGEFTTYLFIYCTVLWIVGYFIAAPMFRKFDQMTGRVRPQRLAHS